MIIQSLQAQNVLKYANLVLNDIPQSGLIAISGRNESGKTSVVETICFALFGRTFSVPQDRLEKIIRWGETSCQVEMVFQANDKQLYRLERSLDYKGTHAAQLYRLDEDKAFATGPHTVEEAVYEITGFDYPQYLDSLYLAQREISTPHSQSDTIKAIAGATDLEDVLEDLVMEAEQERDRISDVEYEINNLVAKINELGSSEEELDSVETETRSLNDKIRETEDAIRQLEKAADEIQSSCPKLQEVGKRISTSSLETSLKTWGEMIDDLEERMEDLRKSCAQIETDSELCTESSDLSLYISDMGDRLEAFEDVRDRMNTYRIQLAALLGEEATNHEELHTEEPLPIQRKKIQSQLSRSRLKNFFTQLLILVSVVLALFTLVGWWQLEYKPDENLADWYWSWLAQRFNGWDAARNHWLQMISIGAGLATVVLIFISMSISFRLKNLKKQEAGLQDRLEDIQSRARLIDEAEEIPFTDLIEGLQKLNNEGITKLLKEYIEHDGLPFSNQLALTTEQDRLIDLMNSCMSSVADLRESIATEIGRHKRIIEESREQIQTLEKDKEEILENARQAAALREEVDVLATQTRRHEEHIQTLETGQYLLTEACRNIYNRFNQVLSKYTGKVMPKLTDERYKQMQIGDDLGVRVFSQEKNDFGELEEFSSGTQRQMLLAVRLAMAKALVEATGQEKQFIILDEPFAFFDRERIRATLNALPKVDKRLDQVWIITQEFEDTSTFVLHIECKQDKEELVIGHVSS
jgi:DNA repair exonuclease SbcCD ATPase subunit